jgi:hypothetical protein
VPGMGMAAAGLPVVVAVESLSCWRIFGFDFDTQRSK